MDWAARTSYFRSCGVEEPIICSTCPRARGGDLVEVVHDGKVGRNTWWHTPRHLWHDLPLGPAVRPWDLQAARPTRERRHKGADWWPRRRPWFQYVFKSADYP